MEPPDEECFCRKCYDEILDLIIRTKGRTAKPTIWWRKPNLVSINQSIARHYRRTK